jgi:hypothetical protein
MKHRRQIGARHIARGRGAFRGGRARPRCPVVQRANPKPDGATRGAGARTGPNVASDADLVQIQGPGFPLFAEGGMVSQSL